MDSSCCSLNSTGIRFVLQCQSGGPVFQQPARRKSSTYEGPRWYGVEFDSAEIKRAFPKPPSTSAKKWVLKEAKRLHSAGKIGKREDMLKRCMQDTGCTKREAEAAHKNLPDKFKRPRGKPRKSPG
jgi:hypothetical protein